MTSCEAKERFKELGVSVAEAAQLLAMSEFGLRNALSADKISAQTARCLELLCEVNHLKKQLAIFKQFREVLESLD